MAPSNSTKKLAKVARSGKKRSIRESSDRTYPMAIAAIVIVGILAVAWGRSERASTNRTAPTLDDHWHAAYGLYLCDASVLGGSIGANPQGTIMALARRTALGFLDAHA